MIAFNSSMPRSGSELLQAILSQHPKIACSTTSPLLEYYFGAAKNLSTQEAQSLSNRDSLFSGFIQGGFQGYTKKALFAKPGAEIYIDKSRGWINYYAGIQKYYVKQIPLICMIRDAAEVIASMETLYLNSNFKDDNPLENVTAHERVDSWLNATPVGLAIRRIINSLHELQQLKNEGKDRPILFVKYEELCESPDETLNQILDHLSLPPFIFDLSNIEKVPGEDEMAFGNFNNLHSVKQKLESTNAQPKADKILGEGLANYVREKCSVYQRAFNYETNLNMENK